MKIAMKAPEINNEISNDIVRKYNENCNESDRDKQ